MTEPLYLAKSEDGYPALLPQMANRHGLITGATGTGKTVTLQSMAERLSFAGVPVFMADVKGDLSGMGAAGSPSEKLLKRIAELGRRIDAGEKDTSVAIDLLWNTQSVMARFEDAGPLPHSVAAELGIVGPAARASGLVRDVRFDHPAGWHRFAQLPVAVWPEGDVFARARVRWLEIQRSGAFLLEQLAAPPPLEPGTGSIKAPMPDLQPDCLAVSLVEGWRGETCHVILTDDQARFRRHKIIDPSFHNWSGLALALRGQAISDFPVCNKSFNLSYCGFDL